MLKLIEKIKFTKKYTVSLNESYETIRISTKGKIIFSSVLTTSAYWLLESLGVYFILLSFRYCITILSNFPQYIFLHSFLCSYN